VDIVAAQSSPEPQGLQERLRRTELLVAAAQRREEGAVDSLICALLADLRAFVRLRLSPGLRLRESCSDVVQSVCREVVEDLGGFEDRGPGSFRAWLFTATLNKIRQKQEFWHAQKRDPRREIAVDAAHANAEGGLYASICDLGGTPSEHAIAREQAERIESAMDQLTTEQREVLLLARIVGLNHREIAERIGKSEVAVRSLLSRGSLRLLAAIEGRVR
jgi:RNA polymerase sigma-70 factor (ECF subfamily)